LLKRPNDLQDAALAGCGKSQFKAVFSSTGALACAGFAALIIDAQPRVAVLPDFFRSLLEAAGELVKLREKSHGLWVAASAAT
jgi:hypothetical protein